MLKYIQLYYLIIHLFVCLFIDLFCIRFSYLLNCLSNIFCFGSLYRFFPIFTIYFFNSSFFTLYVCFWICLSSFRHKPVIQWSVVCLFNMNTHIFVKSTLCININITIYFYTKHMHGKHVFTNSSPCLLASCMLMDISYLAIWSRQIVTFHTSINAARICRYYSP